MASTEIATIDAGSFLALNHTTDEIQQIVDANLDGQEVGEFDLTRLSVPAGGGTAWEMETLSGVEHVKELSGVLVHVKQTRAYWPVPLDEGGSGAPACSSPDAKVGYGKQWATKDDPDPDGEPRQLACHQCPHAQFGSGKNGSQACQQKAQWFLLTEESFLPIVVTLPAMSLKPAKQYMLRLAGAGILYSQVVTKLNIEAQQKGGNKFGVVIPTLAGRLDQDTAAKAKAYAELLKPVFDAAGDPVPAAGGAGDVPPTDPPAPAGAADDDELAKAA